MRHNIGRSVAQSCDLCGSEASKVLYSLAEFAIHACQSCGLLWRVPRPNAAQLTTFYQGSDYWANFETQRALYTRKEKSSSCRLLNRLDQYWRISSGELLDVGCGYGFFLQAAEAQGFTVYGLEPSPEMAAEAQKAVGGQVSRGLIEQANYPDDCFDIVTMIDVLEHVASPTVVLQKATRILRPGGILIMRVPDMNGLLIRTIGILHRGTLGRYQRPMWLLWRYHTFGFTAHTLNSYMEKVGLKVIDYYGEHSKDLSILNQKPWARNPFVKLGVRLVVNASELLLMPDELVMFAQKTR